MASSASPDLKIQLMATGENSGAWGTITNNNLSAIEEAIARTTDVAFSATATVAITLANSNALQQGRNYRLNLTGTGTAGQILLLPTVEKSYLIDNNLSVDVSVRNGTAGGTNTFNIATVGAGRSTIVYTDGSAVTSALDSASSMVVLTTLDVGDAASVGATLGVTGNASVTGTLAIGQDLSVVRTFTFASANGTDRLGVIGDASVGGTFHIQGNTSAQGTLNVKGAVSVASTLGVEGEINNEVGNIVIDPTTHIVEIKGGGSTDAELKLNCRSNSHGQTIKSQEHSAGVTNTMLLPKGANSTLVSEAGTATITNKTYFDLDGDLRDIPKSRTVATTTISAAQTDTGNFIFLTSSDQTVVIPTAAGTFDTGDIFSVVCAGASATISSNITSMFKVGEASATATITLGANKIASVLFVSAQHAYITGT
tara:strand:+ start:696 stop:1976 length:1281 start_codon:yes stop_codon:yes gene_type:complete